MCSSIPKILWIIPVNLANDRPSRPWLISWGWCTQNLDDLLFPLIPVGDVGFDVVRSIFNDGSVAGVKLSVLGFPLCEGLVIVVHLPKASHVHSEILKYGGSVAEDGVCREEGFVEWEVDSNGVGGVTRSEEEVDGGEVCVCGVALVDGHR